MQSSKNEFPIKGGEEIMCQKAHGTTENQVQSDLLYNVDFQTANVMCSFNRERAEN